MSADLKNLIQYNDLMPLTKNEEERRKVYLENNYLGGLSIQPQHTNSCHRKYQIQGFEQNENKKNSTKPKTFQQLHSWIVH